MNQDVEPVRCWMGSHDFFPRCLGLVGDCRPCMEQAQETSRFQAEQRIQEEARREAGCEALRERQEFEESHEANLHITKSSALVSPGFEIDHDVVIEIISYSPTTYRIS